MILISNAVNITNKFITSSSKPSYNLKIWISRLCLLHIVFQKLLSLNLIKVRLRGRERVITGGLLVMFAIFNLYMMSIDGVISLLFAIFFGWSGLKNIALGLRLSQLPEAIGPTGSVLTDYLKS